MKKTLSLILVIACCLSCFVGIGALAEEDTWYMCCSVQNLDSAYWAQMAKGCELFCDAHDDVEYTLLTNGGDDNVQIQGLKDFIAEHGERSIIVYDPSSAANTVNISDVCEEAKVYYSMVNHLAEGLWPEDMEYFAAHFTPDDVTAGYETAKYVFEALGGKGKICYLHGKIGEDAASARFEGLKQAMEEYPNIELLDYQVADWDQGKAMSITETWLTKYDQIDAIITGNDTMGLGAIEALKKKNLNGKVLVTGTDGIEQAFQAVLDGDMLCTIANDGYLLLGYAAAYAYAAATGGDYESGAYYSKTLFVTQENAQYAMDSYINGTPTFDYNDLAYPILKVREH